jgi:hypothetical protein
MTLLNLAIFQRNTGVSQSKIDLTLKQFHQSYNERATSTAQRELDTSMLDIVTKLGDSPLISAQHNEEMVASFPRKPVDEETFISSQELPPVKTKIYDDERHKQRRAKHQPIPSSDTEAAQNEPPEFLI